MRLIATDMDGTLLNEKNEVSPENVTAIRKAQEMGIEVVIATGRSYEAALKPLNEVGLSCTVICLNGAQVYLENGELIRSIPLDREACKKIQFMCNNESTYFEIFTSDGGYSVNRDDFTHIMVEVLSSHYPNLDTSTLSEIVKQRFQDEKIQTVNDFDEIFSNNDIDVYKFLTFALEESTLTRIQEQLENESDIKITTSGHLNLEFNHREANKGNALTFYSNKLGIELKDVMALGDNINDYTMLEVAGFSVAMENAHPTIKELCHFTTKKNTEHGVAFAIDHVTNGDHQQVLK